MDLGSGVYGLHITGLGDVSAYAGGPMSGSPRLAVEREIGTRSPDCESQLHEDRAVIALIDDGVVHIRRDPPLARFVLPHPLSDDELLHPWLVPAAATTSAWNGRRVLHGGLVTDGSRAVAVVGDKEGGKSTLLAWLAVRSELLVLSDDLVVAEGDVVFAGPRLIDLRPGSLPHLPEAAGARLVRGGTRHRLSLPPGPARVELIGIVVLAWAEETSLDPVGPAGRLPLLLPHALTGGVPLGASGVLGFAGYRTWRLQRPRRWESMPQTLDLLTGLLG